MQASFTLLERDLVEFNLYHHNHSPTARRMMGRLRLLVVLLAMMLGIHSVLGTREPAQAVPSLLIWLMGGLAIVAILWLLWPRVVRANARKLIREGANRGMLGPRVVTLSPEGISQTTNYSDCKYFWPSVERIVTTGDYAFVYVSALGAIILPRNAFRTAEEFEAFAAEAKTLAAEAAPPATPPYEMSGGAKPVVSPREGGNA